ncbi:hypothetical protein Rsub_02744 [Raphidocelis subcapitata]|uniref:Pherophorin domain-containing protein n=1 Tax=Raphidocelis subcapitata TaxID=307507 RepID=A0A2V0NQV9_9CHLO|nr:hypothetical protein Rsub_02744 [Raphidocelis subcapitata]|eukprot:GBF90036.1 hypothetical protein Rsub_02744 [Raphidocelis subcapitata]
MAPDGAPRRLLGARRRPSGLLLVAACCAAALAALPQAAAACQAAEQAASNYRLSYVDEAVGPGKACFSLAVAADCSSDAPCCLKSEAKIKKLLLAPNSANPACISRDNLKQLRVTLNAAQTQSRPVKSDGQQLVSTGIKGALSSDALVCVDTSAVPGCNTIKKLCGDTCSFRLTARGPSRGSGKRATCCVNAAAGPPPPTPGKFNLVTINVGTNTSLDAYFEAARARWEKIMTVDLRDEPAYEWWPGYSMPVDDVTIFYQVAKIDGPLEILGMAGPDYVREDYWSTPVTGVMVFDIDDLDTLTPDQWLAVILHEMGHVLGIGSPYYWETRHQCISSCTPESNVTLPYTCANAAREFAALPGCGPTLLVETEAPEGSSCGHWQERLMQRELMTPYLSRSAKGMPISRVTIGGLEDIYGPGSVDYTQADIWNCNAPISAGDEASARLNEGKVILLEPLPRGAGSGGRHGQLDGLIEAARAKAAAKRSAP